MEKNDIVTDYFTQTNNTFVSFRYQANFAFGNLLKLLIFLRVGQLFKCLPNMNGDLFNTNKDMLILNSDIFISAQNKLSYKIDTSFSSSWRPKLGVSFPSSGYQDISKHMQGTGVILLTPPVLYSWLGELFELASKSECAHETFGGVIQTRLLVI